MSAATIQPPRKRFTRSEGERMLDAGLFAGRRFELIDGDLVGKIGQTRLTQTVIDRCMAALMRMFGIKRVRIQLPMAAAGVDEDRSVPEPDLAVWVTPEPVLRGRHPRGNQLTLIVAVMLTIVVCWSIGS